MQKTVSYNGYFYRIYFCEKCERYTTHKTEVEIMNGTFSGDPLDRLDWKCVECEKNEHDD